MQYSIKVISIKKFRAAANIDDKYKKYKNFIYLKVNHCLKGLILDDAKIERVTNTFISEMALALAEKPSSLQMENTYIPELPDGTGKE